MLQEQSTIKELLLETLSAINGVCKEITTQLADNYKNYLAHENEKARNEVQLQQLREFSQGYPLAQELLFRGISNTGSLLNLIIPENEEDIACAPYTVLRDNIPIYIFRGYRSCHDNKITALKVRRVLTREVNHLLKFYGYDYKVVVLVSYGDNYLVNFRVIDLEGANYIAQQNEAKKLEKRMKEIQL